MRLTRPKDEYSCRIANGCDMEEYLEFQTGNSDILFNLVRESVCDGCPFKEIINKLAEYEDKYEN